MLILSGRTGAGKVSGALTRPEPPGSWGLAGEFGTIMESKSSRLPGRYLAALRKHLQQGPQASLQPARALGQEAVRLGLETLDMARIHEGAFAALKGAVPGSPEPKRAMAFFAEAITPIESTHAPALAADAQLEHVNQALEQRAVALAASARSLKQSITRRRIAEEALKKSGAHAEKLLTESRRLQSQCRSLIQQILAAQETNRGKISRELQNELAQTLLGINVRLLTVKRQGAIGTQAFQKELANTRRVVEESRLSLSRFTREFGKPQETRFE